MRLLSFAMVLFVAAPMTASPEKTSAPAPAERPAEKAADRTPSISERARDLTRRDGFLPFYLDTRKGQLLLEISPPDSAVRKGALRRIAQRGVLDALLDLAARPEASTEVRAVVQAKLQTLRARLRGKHSTDPAVEAHLRLAEGDLTEFLEKPEVRKARPPRRAAPPGRPIGE